MKDRGVSRIEGIDVTPEMLDRARDRGIYESLAVGDIVSTGLEADRYDLLIASLVDEHLRDLQPLYGEVYRLLQPGGWFVIVGYHPHFLMKGIPTHFHRATGEAVAVEAHVHLLSDHFKGGSDAGLTLREFHEGVIDEAWAAAKPRWAKYKNEPVSFAMVWGRS
jgi:SAM-dependent methyltransferase